MATVLQRRVQLRDASYTAHCKVRSVAQAVGSLPVAPRARLHSDQIALQSGFTMFRERLSNIATGLALTCAVVVTGLVVRRHARDRTSISTSSTIAPVKNWSQYVAGRPLGRTGSPVTVVEFGDFQCPFCGRFALYIDSLQSLGQEVRVLFRHFPLPGHPHALKAARVSECAAELGRFEEMHDALFAFPESIGTAAWWWFGRKADIGVDDSTAFELCARDTARVQSIERDIAAGRQLGVRGTPTLLIHDIRLDGVPSFDSLRRLLERASRKGTND